MLVTVGCIREVGVTGRGADPADAGHTVVLTHGIVPPDGADPILAPGRPEGRGTTPGRALGTENTRGPGLLIDGPAAGLLFGDPDQGALSETEHEQTHHGIVWISPIDTSTILSVKTLYLLFDGGAFDVDIGVTDELRITSCN
jgi:hypothetical protein